MPKKKTQFPKRDKKIKLTAIIASITAVVVVAAIVFGVTFQNARVRWIMEFNGERIHRAEFELFASVVAESYIGWAQQQGIVDIWEGGQNDQSAEAKLMALEWLEESLAWRELARQHNVTLTAEELAEVQENVDQFLADYRLRTGRRNRLPEYRLIEIYGEHFLRETLIEQLGANHELDMADMEEFAERRDERLENDQWTFLDLYFSVFYAATMAEVTHFIEQLALGGNFHDVLAELSVNGDSAENEDVSENEYASEDDDNAEGEAYAENYDAYANGYDADNGDENAGEYTEDGDEDNGWMSFDELIHFFGLNLQNEADVDVVRALAQLQVGDHSSIAHSQGGLFGVVLVEYIEYPDFDELEQEWLESFTAGVRAEYAWNRFQEFMATLDFDLNQRAFNSVRMGRL